MGMKMGPGQGGRRGWLHLSVFLLGLQKLLSVNKITDENLNDHCTTK